MAKMRARLLYWMFRWTTASSRFSERRFTPAGRLVISAAILFAIFGLDPHRATTYQAFGFAVGLLGFAVVAAPRVRSRFEVRRSLPRFGTAGEPLRYATTLRNHGRRVERSLIAWEDVDAPLPTFEEVQAAPPVDDRGADRLAAWLGWPKWIQLVRARHTAAADPRPLPDLPPRGECTVAIEVVPSHRGRLRLEGVVIGRPDPLGLFVTVRREVAQDHLLILPRRYPLPPVSLPGRRRYQSGGVAQSSTVGESPEFVELREYRPGDPLRRIHWRSWAKLGKPVVKEHEDEYFVRNALVLDTFAPPSEAFEEAVSVAASFACGVLPADSLLDLLFVEREVYCVTAGRGVGTTDHLLEVLAGVEPSRGRDFCDLHEAVLRRNEALSGCVCVLQRWDDDRRRLIRTLRASGTQVLVFLVADPSTGLHDTGADEPIHRLEPGRIAEGLALSS